MAAIGRFQKGDDTFYAKVVDGEIFRLIGDVFGSPSFEKKPIPAKGLIELRRFTALPSLAAWGWARPTLVVVDYAASLLEPVRQWLRALSQRAAPAGGPPLRLLLLERHASAAEGWLQSLYLGGDGLAGIPRLFDRSASRRPGRTAIRAPRAWA